jgi:hypothetical protein
MTITVSKNWRKQPYSVKLKRSKKNAPDWRARLGAVLEWARNNPQPWPSVPVCSKHYPGGECVCGYGSGPYGPPCLHCVMDRAEWAIKELRADGSQNAIRIADVLSGAAVHGYFMRAAGNG